MRLSAFLLVAFGVGGCSSYEGHIRARLHEAGVPQQTSACAADYLIDHLSSRQLQTLINAFQQRERVKQLSMQELERRVLAIGDPRIVAVAEAASLSCFLAG